MFCSKKTVVLFLAVLFLFTACSARKAPDTGSSGNAESASATDAAETTAADVAGTEVETAGAESETAEPEWVLTKETCSYNGEAAYVVIYTYDDRYQLISEDKTASNGEKTLKEYIHTYNDQGMLRQTECLLNGEKWYTDTYNEYGLAESYTYMGDNREVNVYDDAGNVIRILYYYSNANNSGGPSQWEDLTYDQDGHVLTSQLWENAEGGYVDEYVTSYAHGVGLLAGDYNFYDEQGRLVKKTGIDENGNPVETEESVVLYEYDQNGNLIRSSSIWSTNTYEYDDNGLLLKQTADDTEVCTVTEYKYDAYGNVTEKRVENSINDELYTYEYMPKQ